MKIKLNDSYHVQLNTFSISNPEKQIGVSENGCVVYREFIERGKDVYRIFSFRAWINSESWNGIKLASDTVISTPAESMSYAHWGFLLTTWFLSMPGNWNWSRYVHMSTTWR